MNNCFYNSWNKWQKWNGAIVLWICFWTFLVNGLSLAILQSKGNFERFIERLHSYDIGKAKTTVPSFKHLPEKLSIPTAFYAF